MTTRSWGQRNINRRENEGTEMIWQHKQSLRCDLLEANDDQESFPQSSSVFGPFPDSQLGCEALHTLQLVINLVRVPHAAIQYSRIGKTKALYRCDRQLESQSLKFLYSNPKNLFALQHISETWMDHDKSLEVMPPPPPPPPPGG